MLVDVMWFHLPNGPAANKDGEWEGGAWQGYVPCASVGEVYRWAQRQYGRCVGAIEAPDLDGPPAIGWVFKRRVPREGARREHPTATVLVETWVEVLWDVEEEGAA